MTTFDVGGDQDAARAAAKAALDYGCTLLESKVIAHVASWGGVCWQTYTALQGVLRRPDGRLYHRESIGRACRWLRDRGVMANARVMPRGKIDSPLAKFRTSTGTTVKSVNWRELGARNPLNRRARREKRIQQAQLDRAAVVQQKREELRQQVVEQQRFAGAVASTAPVKSATTPRLGLDAELAAAADELRRAMEPRWAAAERSEQASLRSAAAVRGPPE